MVLTLHALRNRGCGVGILTNNVVEWEPHWTRVIAPARDMSWTRDKAIAFVSVQPKQGWTITVTKRKLDKPVKAEGAEPEAPSFPKMRRPGFPALRPICLAEAGWTNQ